MIREGHPDDLAALRAIQASALDEPWPELLELAVDGPQTLLVRTDPAPGADGYDVPLGYVLAIETDGVAYLAEIAVAPDAQGEGHGSALLSTFLERARDRGVVECRLTARADDEGLHAFYQSHGFQAGERIEDHYEDGDGLVFVRTLADDR